MSVLRTTKRKRTCGRAWLIESLIPDAYWVDRRLKRNGSVSGLRTTVDSPDAASLLTRYRPAYWDRKNRLSIASAWASEFYKTYTGTFPAIDPDQVASAFALALSDVNYTNNTKPYDLLLKDSIEPGENPNNTRTLKQYLTEHDVLEPVQLHRVVRFRIGIGGSIKYLPAVDLQICDRLCLQQLRNHSSSFDRCHRSICAHHHPLPRVLTHHRYHRDILGHNRRAGHACAQLEASGALKHVSAGIERLKTFREPVSIRVNDENSLELVFEDDPAYKALNRKYRRLNFNEKF